MASKIRILSDQTINQIAAGEVIENPASVVKELVENAIDAKATQVRIEILAGGFQSIKISDDGVGMSPDDAVLCLERHATSKIVSADDLFSLTTMGFRGEALASIAAISKMQVVTALESEPAIALEIDGGKIVHAGPAARSRGTTIEVRSLFYNVPARKKFQKSAAASSAEITKVITHLALAHPEIGIDLIQQNRTVFSLPASAGEAFLTVLQRRTKDLLSEEFLPSSHPLDFKQEQYEGKGLIGDPLFSRHNRLGQYLFINRRPVFCLPVSYAVRDAYGTRLDIDRHPVYVLHLFMPSALVDVNVHPQKKEVRLREEGLLKYMLQGAVNDALGSSPSALSPIADLSFAPSINPFAFSEDGYSGFRTAADFNTPLKMMEEREQVDDLEIPLVHEMAIVGLYKHYLIIDAKTLPLSLAFDKGVIWFDMQAVEARIQFDSMMRQAQDLPLSQGLLIPEAVSFSRDEAHLLQANLESIQKLGLQLRQAGDAVYLVEAIPPFVEEGEVKNILEELIAELHGLEKDKGQDKLQRLAACISRRVRSRKKAYTPSEARKLIEQLMRCKDQRHCPQGKLTLFYTSEDEVEKHFATKLN